MEGNLAKLVERRSGEKIFRIPSAVADLLERRLGLQMGGRRDKRGLGWEREGYGVVFLEMNLKTEQDLKNIYVLPSSLASWRTPPALKRLLDSNGLSRFDEFIGTGDGGKELRIKNVSWQDATELLPVVARWSFYSQTLRELVIRP